MKLLPSRHRLCRHQTTIRQFIVSFYSKPHIKGPLCLAVTCHIHFWQNDWDLLHATAVTEGWNRCRNKGPYTFTFFQNVHSPYQPPTPALWTCIFLHRICLCTLYYLFLHKMLTCNTDSHTQSLFVSCGLRHRLPVLLPTVTFSLFSSFVIETQIITME